MNRALTRSAYQCSFDPPVLIAKRDLQMKHMLTMALEAKMPGFNDSCVHRTDSNFVNLHAGHREEVSHAGNRRRGRTLAEAVRCMKSNRL